MLPMGIRNNLLLPCFKMSELTGTAAIRNGGPLLGGSESPWAAGCCEMPETGPL